VPIDRVRADVENPVESSSKPIPRRSSHSHAFRAHSGPFHRALAPTETEPLTPALSKGGCAGPRRGLRPAQQAPSRLVRAKWALSVNAAAGERAAKSASDKRALERETRVYRFGDLA